MYAACLFCHRALGDNAVMESFPVGRQLAFDGARGRLWVVCPHCARWNLTPLEQRWEAMEEAERHFRDARVRAATDEIALARVAGGLTLVRVGRARMRELTAWRYGRELARRLWRTAGVVAGGTVAVGAAAVAGVGAGIGVRPELVIPFLHPAIAILALQAGGLGLSLRPVRIPGPDGRTYEVFRSEFAGLYLEPADVADAWRLHVKHGYGVLSLEGHAAVDALRPLLARINRRGALRGRAVDASRWIEAHGGAAASVLALARASRERGGDFEARRRAFESGEAIERNPFAKNETPGNLGALHRMPAVERLALEVAMVEDAERRAMEEELAPLTRAWRDAEAIAAIADGLALPAAVERRAAAMRQVATRDALAPERPRD
ncbi:hypothetical protein [Roseisolibacter agri]|uniref:CpXC domain-containing protein n=1 Tax=Roseisolibacter agri TaxID=2014610 RepID=A0AA37QGU6_9BACT|nr:hypothetical protein [Roseisolibacter agri]GLC26553.1 hypothetical protein rosag_30660 [Roseisolibacter agri]